MSLSRLSSTTSSIGALAPHLVPLRIKDRGTLRSSVLGDDRVLSKRRATRSRTYDSHLSSFRTKSQAVATLALAIPELGGSMNRIAHRFKTPFFMLAMMLVAAPAATSKKTF
ncbi:MAG: hypothetical protein WCT29_02760 [Candidatus Paceibacterota bacterium]